MKTLGLLGGTTWVSTVEYYRLINQGVNNIMGGLNFARCILYSINMEDVNRLKKINDREGIVNLLLDAVGSLSKAGIDGLVLCANTLHFAVDRINEAYDIPVIHIARATAAAVKRKGIKTIGLLGTRQTMEQDFYTSILKEEGIETLIPDPAERQYIDDIIFTELAREEFHQHTRERFLAIMDDLEKRGAEGMVLGCTEIPLLIRQEHTPVTLFNTLDIHAQAAVAFATS